MIEKGFEYWFTDSKEFRSPFPMGIREELKVKTKERFSEWINTMGKEDASKLEDSELVEMFEMFMFNVGISLCPDLDEQITITYPFMPRCGDEVDDKKHGLSFVIQREIIDIEKEKRQMRLILETQSDKKSWQTEFDLPA